MHRAIRRVKDAAEWSSSSSRATWLTVFALCLYVFLITGHWTLPTVTDAYAAYLPAWEFVHHGTFTLEHLHGPGLQGPFFLHVGNHLVSNRMPGVILMAVPFQALFRVGGGTASSALTASVLTAIVVSAAAMANLAVVLRRLVPPRAAVLAALVLAFGSGIWTVAAGELWAHGPDILWLSIVLVGLSSSRWWLAASGFVPAILTRPHLSVAAMAIAIALGVFLRKWRPTLVLGASAPLGVGSVLLWNAHFFAHANVQGGYAYAMNNVTATGSGSSGHLGVVSWYAVNFAGAFVSPMRGVILFSPFVLIAVAAGCSGWRSSPAWARAALLGGVAYELVQLKVNSFTGQQGFYSNRLMIELLFLAAPLCAIGIVRRCQTSATFRVATITSAGLAITIHSLGALMRTPWTPRYSLPGHEISPWTDWEIGHALRLDGGAGIAVCILGVGITAFVVSRVARKTAKPPVNALAELAVAA